MPFRLDVLKFAMPVALLVLVPACSGGGATMIPSSHDSMSSAARGTLSGGSGGGTAKPGGGGGGTPAPSNSFKVTARIEGKSSSNPIGYYAVYDTYVIGGSTYHMGGFPKIDVANGPAEVGACVTVSGTVVNGLNYFSKLVTEVQSLCG